MGDTAPPQRAVGAQQNRLRDREAKRGRRLQIDYQLELGRLLYGQIGGFGALENLIHEICCSAPRDEVIE